MLAHAQSDSIKNQLDAQFWSLEGDIRTYLLTNRHAKSKRHMRRETKAFSLEASRLFVEVLKAYELDSDLYGRSLNQISDVLRPSDLADSLRLKIREHSLKVAEENLKEYPYWLSTLFEIRYVTDLLRSTSFS